MIRSPRLSHLFLLIWTGQLLSKIGCGMSAFALGITLLQETQSISSYSFFLLYAFLPGVLLAPLGGVLADRRDRREMMIFGELGSMLGVLFIVVMMIFAPDWQWPLYIGVLAVSGGAALHLPAFKAMVTDLLDEESYAKASGLLQLAEASKYVLAPVIAAILLTHFSLKSVLFLDLLTSCLAVMILIISRRTMAFTPHKRDQTENVARQLMAGTRFLLDKPVLVKLLLLTTLVTFLAGVLQAVFTPLVLSLRDVSAAGAIQAIATSGMLLSSLAIGVMRKRSKQTLALPHSLGILGLFFMLIGVSTTAVFFTLASFCLFFTLPFINTNLEVLFRQNIVSEMQGRIWSLISMLSQLGMVVALGLAGVLADHCFNPLLTDNGPWASTLGGIIGTGATRGSGLMVIIAGSLLVLFSVFLARRRLFEPEKSLSDMGFAMARRDLD